MTPEQLFVYTEEVNIHAQLALSNFATFQNIVANEEDRQRREAWMYLQSFLSHFGMVSKLLFAPSSKARLSKDRAKLLQEHLETDKSNALNDRDARNAVEHLDERMDNWLTQEGRGILESVFPNRKAYEYLNIERWVVRRVYLVEESIFITQEAEGPKEMELQPLVEALNRIMTISNTRLGSDDTYHIIQPSQG